MLFTGPCHIMINSFLDTEGIWGVKVLWQEQPSGNAGFEPTTSGSGRFFPITDTTPGGTFMTIPLLPGSSDGVTPRGDSGAPAYKPVRTLLRKG